MVLLVFYLTYFVEDGLEPPKTWKNIKRLNVILEVNANWLAGFPFKKKKTQGFSYNY